MKNQKYIQAGVASLVFLLVIVTDQWLKIWVKTHYALPMDEIPLLGGWVTLEMTENEGMAYGMSFLNKYFLTAFRICAVAGLLGYIVLKLLKGISWYSLLSFTLLTAGALGNVIDCVFYGVCFTEYRDSFQYQGYTILRGQSMWLPLSEWGSDPEAKGWFCGRVVDMIRVVPDNIPYVCDIQLLCHLLGFVCNIADIAVSVAVVLLLLHQFAPMFQRRK